MFAKLLHPPTTESMDARISFHLHHTNAVRVGFQNEAAGIAVLKAEHGLGLFLPLCVLSYLPKLICLPRTSVISWASCISHVARLHNPAPAGMQTHSVLLASQFSHHACMASEADVRPSRLVFPSWRVLVAVQANHRGKMSCLPAASCQGWTLITWGGGVTNFPATPKMMFRLQGAGSEHWGSSSWYEQRIAKIRELSLERLKLCSHRRLKINGHLPLQSSKDFIGAGMYPSEQHGLHGARNLPLQVPSSALRCRRLPQQGRCQCCVLSQPFPRPRSLLGTARSILSGLLFFCWDSLYLVSVLIVQPWEPMALGTWQPSRLNGT